MRYHFAGQFLVAGMLAVCAIGCADQKPQSTRLTASDYIYTVSETRAKLSESSFLATRTAQSPPVTIGVKKVENLTSDVIPESEQWMFVLNVQNSPEMQTLAQQKNIHFQMPPERLEELRRDGFAVADTGWQPPTHELAAVFRSVVRSSRDKEGYIDKRSDQYQLQYTITDLKSGEVQWSGIVEFKRAASGAVQN